MKTEPMQDGVLKEMRERFEEAARAESFWRDDAVEDLQFMVGEQWPAELKRNRELDRRPCLTFNRLPALVGQVTNDQRMNKPSIKVHPVEDADVETAKVRQGLIRHIEVSSKADAAYDTAVNAAATIGVGYFGLLTAYCNETSFDQEIKFRRFRDSLKVYFDPLSQEPDGSDARYVFVSEEMPMAEFKRRYPDADTSSADIGIRAPGDKSVLWMSRDMVRIVEYYRVVEEPATLCLYDDGTTELKHLDNEDESEESGDDQPLDDALKAQPDTGKVIVAQRPSSIRMVKWSKCTAASILEETTIPCRWIPIFPVYGSEHVVEGRVHRAGLVRWAKDPMRMYNYWMTSATEEVGLRSKSPYIMAEGQNEGYEDMWASANLRSPPALIYKPVTIDGTLAPAPARQPMADVPVGVVTMARQAVEDLKATTGLYDASIGARGNETSGKAIMARQRQGDTANFHYIDNLARSIRQCALCLLDMIPQVYSTERVVQIIGEGDEPQPTRINVMDVDPVSGLVQSVLNDMTKGKYDVTVSVGPSYSTLRQEAAQAMVEVGQAYPPLWQAAGDIMVKNMDWPGAEQIAERLKVLLPPPLQGMDEKGRPQQQQIPPEVEQAIGQATEAIQMYQQRVGELEAALQSKQEEIARQEEIEAAKLASQERIAREKLQTEARIDLLRIKKDLLIAREKAAAEAQAAAQQPADDEVGEVDLDGVSMDPPPVEPPPPPQPTPTDMALMAVAESMQMMARALSAPKRPVRDAEGRIVQVITDSEVQ